MSNDQALSAIQSTLDDRKVLIGKNIRFLRKINRCTAEQLGKELGVSAPAVSAWETGKSNCSIEKLEYIAHKFGVNSYDLQYVKLFDPRYSVEVKKDDGTKVNHYLVDLIRVLSEDRIRVVLGEYALSSSQRKKALAMIKLLCDIEDA